ncbi:hypothetical protein [Desulfobacterium sp. N47]|uniref:Uncharacterized protein n=1 Tax=uncultured Desulfobacterium sp. TaxID=201089 RepID=E1YHQ3_9BACT|nr:unknown protein [uncultured Desulfobacterium sp.]
MEQLPGGNYYKGEELCHLKDKEEIAEEKVRLPQQDQKVLVVAAAWVVGKESGREENVYVQAVDKDKLMSAVSHVMA